MTDLLEIAPPPPTRRAPSAPTHSNSSSIDSDYSSSSIHQPFKPPPLRLDSNGSISLSSSPVPHSSSSPRNLAATASFSGRTNSPLGRRSNLRLASPRASILSPSQSLPHLAAAGQSDEVLRDPLSRSSSNNRLSAIISKKAGISPIVTSVPADDRNTTTAAGPMANVELPQETNGTEAHMAALTAATAAATINSSPSVRPHPLDRPSSISLSLPQQKSSPSDANHTNGSFLHAADEEEAPALIINHSVGAVPDTRYLQQPPQQPLSSASSASSSSPVPHHDPITPMTPFTPHSAPPPLNTPSGASSASAAVDAAYKDQLDGVLRRRGDSHLNLQALDPNTGQLTVALPLQMRQMSAIGPERRVAFRVDRADGLDLVDIIPEEHGEGSATRLTKEWHAGMRASRGILKTANIKGTEEERRRRTARAVEREKEWLRFVQTGSTLVKYNAQGKPQKRWVYVSEDGHELVWEKPTDQWLRPKKRWDEEIEDEKKTDNEHNKKHTPPLSKPTTSRSAGDIHTSSHHGTLKPPSPHTLHQHSSPTIHATDSHTEQPNTPNSASSSTSSRSKRRSSLPSMRILNWKINPDRTRYLADVLGVHYGPYHSADRFSRFLQRKDYQTGFPWLAFTVEFPDRTLDLVGNREDEVQQWFLGVQALAPLSVHHLTMGGVLWQRLIMKLNFYGLEPIKTERISSWTSSDDKEFHW